MIHSNFGEGGWKTNTREGETGASAMLLTYVSSKLRDMSRIHDILESAQ